jgi:CRP-like cAMP-binding protein
MIKLLLIFGAKYSHKIDCLLRSEAKMARAKIPTNIHGPAIRGVDPWAPSAGKMRQFLSAEERARLAVLSSIVRLNKGEKIYREGQRADAVFNIITGVVKAYKTGS